MMKASIQQKLTALVERHEELGVLLSQPDIINEPQRFRDLSREYSQLAPLVKCFQAYLMTEKSIHESTLLCQEADPELRQLAEEELQLSQQRLVELEQELQLLLLPQDPHDRSNIFLEIRAAAGGDESAIFAGDLLRMYCRYAEQQGWQTEILYDSPGEHGGYKSVTARIIGEGAYSKLKFESGAHRVQRVPETEAQGRIHTSTCTVAILPEIDEIDSININPADLKIDTYRASGAGGQHVNKTDSAIRITHLPTGLVVECQDERSQHKNRARAMSLLQAKLLASEQSKQRQAQAETRRNLVGTGDRSERIRTYNFPQGLLTDHRINLTLYKLSDIMLGQLNEVIDPLLREHQADLLATLGDDHA